MPTFRYGPARRPTVYSYALPASVAQHVEKQPVLVGSAPGVRELHAAGAGTTARAVVANQHIPVLQNTIPASASRVLVGKAQGVAPGSLPGMGSVRRPILSKLPPVTRTQAAGLRGATFVGQPTRPIPPPPRARLVANAIPARPPMPGTQRPVVGRPAPDWQRRPRARHVAVKAAADARPPAQARPIVAPPIAPVSLLRPHRARLLSSRLDDVSPGMLARHTVAITPPNQGMRLAGRQVGGRLVKALPSGVVLPPSAPWVLGTHIVVGRARMVAAGGLPPLAHLARTWTAPIPITGRFPPRLVPGGHGALLRGTVPGRLVRPPMPPTQLPQRPVVVIARQPVRLPRLAISLHSGPTTVVTRPVVTVARAVSLPPRPRRAVFLPPALRPIAPPSMVVIARVAERPKPRPGAIALPPARPRPPLIPRAKVGTAPAPRPLPPAARVVRLATPGNVTPPKSRVLVVPPARPLRMPGLRGESLVTPLPSPVSHVRPPQAFIIRLPLLVPPPPRPGLLLRTPYIAYPLPPDLPAAVALWLQNTAAVTSALGHTAATPKIYGEFIPANYPGTTTPTKPPLLAYAEVGEHDFGYESADEFGVVHGFPLGQFQVSVWATSRKQARDLGRTVASALNDAPLTFADGVLMEFRLADAVMVPSPEIGAGGAPADYQYTLTFLYRVMRTL